jgi:hypothetical protein
MEIRVNKQSKYKALNTMVARDKRLSFKARGIMFYLLSNSSDWKGHVYDIQKASGSDGIGAIKSAMKELVDLGYVVLRNYPKQADGRFNGKYYEVFETSLPQKREPKPEEENSKIENFPLIGNIVY